MMHIAACGGAVVLTSSEPTLDGGRGAGTNVSNYLVIDIPFGVKASRREFQLTVGVEFN
jgi:hypothetical protein